MSGTPENVPILDTPAVKPKRVRQMTPELLEKLKLARERAKELRDQAKKEKENIALPEPEKSKVAKYLATRKLIKKTIQKEIEQELETEIFEPDPEPEPILPQEKNFGSVPPPVKVSVKPVKKVEPDSDSDDEYTTIKVLKSKLVKYSKSASGKKAETFEPPQPPQPPAKWVNPYSTGHLYNLANTGYKF